MPKILTSPLTALVALVGLIYCLTAPATVMPFDSAEMTLRGFALTVMHPPGYPLQTLFNAALIRLLFFVEPLTAVSLGNIALGLLTIVGAGVLSLKLSSTRGLSLVGLMAISPLFWSYATTPEVFIGLQLFAVGFCWLLFFPEDYRRPYFVTFLALSVLHHHTIVFLAPWVVRAAWLNRAHKKAHLLTLVAGIASLASYGVLMLFNPDNLLSWGEVSSWRAVLDHFLRKEYGTFSLAISPDSPPWLDRVRLGLTVIVSNAFVPLIVVASSLHQVGARWTVPQKILSATVIVYFVVFTLSGTVPLSLAGVEIYSRFFLLPIVLIYVLAISLLGHMPTDRWRVIVVLIICTCVWNTRNIVEAATSGMREISEQFHRDLLSTLPPNAVVLMKGDTLLFTSSYLQTVLGVRRDIIFVPPSLLPWEGKKLHRSYPEKFTENYRAPTLHERLVKGLSYNEVGFSFRIREGQSVERQEMSYRVSTGPTSLSFSCRNDGPIYSGPAYPFKDFNLNGGQVLNYGQCDFYEALYLLRADKPHAALRSLRLAVKKSRYNPIYQERLCFVLKSDVKEYEKCNQRLDDLLEHTDPEYLKSHKAVFVPDQVKVILKDGVHD